MMVSCSKPTPSSNVDFGRSVYEKMGCNACHSVKGQKKLGPPLNGKWGTDIRHNDGTILKLNEEYFRESLFEPRKHIVEGYTPIMANYKAVLTEKDVKGLIAYIKSLK